MDVERKLDMSLDELIKENPREKAARGTDRGGRGRKGSPEGSSGKGKPSAVKAQTTNAAPTVRLCCLVIGRFLPDRVPWLRAAVTIGTTSLYRSLALCDAIERPGLVFAAGPSTHLRWRAIRRHMLAAADSQLESVVGSVGVKEIRCISCA